jgi:tetratricopeptide (TPR) repeat protein/predicted phosphodiesterase
METKHFSWLHLTDLHYGLKGQSCLWPTLREAFFDDLSRLHDLSGPWDTVLFTGDLVQSGSPQEFAEMQAGVLDRLWDKLAELGSGKAVLLAVPGNHDLARPDPKVDNAAIDALLNPSGFSSIAEKFWANADGAYRRVINDTFGAYSNWWENAPHRPKSGFTNGSLPGDFACTLSLGDLRVGVIGLNTTFLQLKGGDYRRCLVWDPRQIHEVCRGAVDDWVANHDVHILMTHQGADWLTPQCEQLGLSEIAPPGRFAVHLYGHMHETSISYLKLGGGDAIRRCQGNSVFGMEKFGESLETVRAHGYAAGRITFERENRANFRVWPRIATNKIGAWRFVPDFENAVLEHSDQATRSEPIPLSLSKKNRVGSAGSINPSAVSSAISIPKSSWPTELEIPDSILLRPESRVVRFSRQRMSLLDTILGWVLDPGERIKLRLQAGDGGSGKTRLLIEVCDRLESLHGWRAGFVDKAHTISSMLSALLQEGKPVLLVLDYAESRTNEIIEIVRNYVSTKNAPLLRLALLAREGGDWWDRLADAAGTDVIVAAVLRGLNTKTGPYRMSQEHIEVGDRAALFHEAWQDFALRKKSTNSAVVAPDLSADIFGNLLFIQLAALASVRGQVSINDQELLSTTVGHERSVWRRLLSSMGLSQDLLHGLEQGIALLTLSNGGRSAKSAKDLLARTPRLRALPTATRTCLFDLLRRIYPLEGGLRGLQPDLLGETLVSESLAQDDELLDVAFGESSSTQERQSALTVLTRLARRVPSEDRWLRRALERNLRQISEDALAVSVQTGFPLPDVYADVVKNAERQERRLAVEKLGIRIPAGSLNLASLNVEVRRQAVTFLHEKKASSPAKRQVALSDALSQLAFALGSKGLFAEAAEAAADAIRNAELVYRSNTDEDRQRLAAILSNAAGHLRDVGRFDEALKAVTRAEALRRALNERKPNVFAAEWAASLVNLGLLLGQVGQPNESLKIAQQAVDLWRGLTRKHPHVDNSLTLAKSLGNLSASLSSVGKFEAALKTSRLAERLFRRLAKADPDSHIGTWAISIGAVSNQLRLAGHFDESLKASEKAELLLRQFAKNQPDVFTGPWARQLQRLGTLLHDVGRFSEGLEISRKAESLWRELAQSQPEAHSAEWAASLGNLGIALGDAGLFDEALKAAQEAENIMHGFASRQPGAYTANWVSALSNLADARVVAGQYSDALKVAQIAIQELMQLALQYPRVYSPWLGFAHRAAAESLFQMDRLAEAAVEAGRSASLWSEVANDRQNYESVQIAKTFLVLIRSLIALDKREAALAGLGDAFSLLRRPLEMNSRPLRPLFSKMLQLLQPLGNEAVAQVVPNELLCIVNAND